MPFESQGTKTVTTLKNLMNLKGRRALITGATGGIGKVMADTLAELGADLVLIDRPGSDLKSVTETLTQRWRTTIQYRHCDLERQDQRAELINWLIGSGGSLNVLINNAAFVGTSEMQGWAVPFEEQTIDTWRRALEVNLTAAFELSKMLSPLLRNSTGANIVNIASIYASYGPDWSLYEGTAMSNPGGYAASKGGLLQLTRWLATTMAPVVRVNAISPGGVFRNQPAVFVKKYEKRTPLARMATEDDFRGAIAFLTSDLSAYVTGHNLEVDGGWGCW